MSWSPAVIDGAIVGSFRIGEWFDYFRRAFDKLKNNRLFFNVSFSLRYRRLLLGDRDATTGHHAVSYDSTESIEMLVVTPTNRGILQTACGLLATYACSGLTMDVVYIGDQICTSEGWYSVLNVKVHQVGDSFFYREAELEYLPMEQET